MIVDEANTKPLYHVTKVLEQEYFGKVGKLLSFLAEALFGV